MGKHCEYKIKLLVILFTILIGINFLPTLRTATPDEESTMVTEKTDQNPDTDFNKDIFYRIGTIFVDDDYDSSTSGWQIDHFDTIQDGIDASPEFGTVVVHSGLYTENVSIDKTIHLLGAGRDTTILEMPVDSNYALILTANYSYISGFTFLGLTQSSSFINVVYIDGGKYCTISNNTMGNGYHCIQLENAHNNSIMNNIISFALNSSIFNYLYGHFGITLLNAHDNMLINNTISHALRGIFLYENSHNNTLSNNALSHNFYGIYIASSPYNIIKNNTLNVNGYGFTVLTSSDNSFENNTLAKNSRDLMDYSTNIYKNNRFNDNSKSTMIDDADNTRIAEVNDTIDFCFSVYYPNGTACNLFSYDIATRPCEIIHSSINANTIVGEFIVKKVGLYSLLVRITDADTNSFEKTYTYYINANKIEEITIYLRPDENPIQGAPTGRHDVASFLFTPPVTTSSFGCSTWIQASPDEIIHSIPCYITDISMRYWYRSWDPGLMGIQKNVQFDQTMDYKQSVPASSNYIQRTTSFSDLHWIMDYPTDWYWLAFKLSGTFPRWKTTPSSPSYATISYIVTDTPLIKNLTNPDVQILSATSQSSDTNKAEIIVYGKGTTNLTVKMPNPSLLYSVTFDGVAGNTSNCTFTQHNGELLFNLILHSEHTLFIEESPGLSDLIVSDFSVEAIGETASQWSSANNPKRLKLTATITNNGTIDITGSFNVAFFASDLSTAILSNTNQIGMIELPFLNAGDIVEVSIIWNYVSEIQVLGVYADSSMIVHEVDETNNCAFLMV